MKKGDYIAFCQILADAVIDQPFARERSKMVSATYIARHGKNRKWFAAIMEREGKPFVNLKCDPTRADVLRSAFAGIRPAYHMNKDHWISVYLQSDVPDELIYQLTRDSHRLTA